MSHGFVTLSQCPEQLLRRSSLTELGVVNKGTLKWKGNEMGKNLSGEIL